MPKKHNKYPGISKFIIVLVIFVLYLAIATIQFGIKDGLMVALLSWSFFVFCTPIADAGFLLDFPVRLLTGYRMLYTEIGVWAFAVLLNIVMFSLNPAIYNKTSLLKLFQSIVTTPWPLWGIILLSGIGTFVSIYLGDDAFDVVASKHRLSTYQKERLGIYFSITTYIFTILLYLLLINISHINIKLF